MPANPVFSEGDYPNQGLTREIIAGCYSVQRTLGFGFKVKTGLLLDPVAVPQTINYLKASKLSLGLICYFGPRLKVKRVVCSRDSFHTTTDPTQMALKTQNTQKMKPVRAMGGDLKNRRDALFCVFCVFSVFCVGSEVTVQTIP